MRRILPFNLIFVALMMFTAFGGDSTMMAATNSIVINDKEITAGSEIEDYRTANSKTYYLGLNDNGKPIYNSEFHTGHINYFDKTTGKYEKIDVKLVDENNKYVVKKAGYNVSLPKNSLDPIIFTAGKSDFICIPISYNGHSLSNVPAVKVNDYDLLYSNIYNNVDMELSVGNNLFRKDIIIKERPALASGENLKISFYTNIDAKVKAEPTTENPLKIEDIYFPKAIAVDANGWTIPITLSFENNILTKILPYDFVQNAVYPIRTDATTSYYAGAGDGYVTRTSTTQNWTTLRANANGTSVNYTGTTALVQAYHYFDGSVHYRAIIRLFLPIDTSGLPDGVPITGAVLKVYKSAVGAPDTAMYVTQSTTASNTTLATADYNDSGTTGGGLFYTGSMATGDYTSIILNAAGISWIIDDNYTKLSIREYAHDILDSEPVFGADDCQAAIYTSEYTGTSRDPYLSITYSSPPTVGTMDDTSVEETTATLNGNVSATGGTSITDRGFVYDTSSHGAPGDVAPAASGYAQSTIESGSFSTGTFTANIATLTKGEEYFYRAWAKNDLESYGYGDEGTLLTKPDEPNTFVATAHNDTAIDLSWAQGTGADYTYIMYKDGSYPTDYTDGTLATNTTSTGYTLGGLTSGHVYYFRAWSWAAEGGLGQWSDAYAQAFSATMSTPSISTSAASSVSTVSARLNSILNNDGGQACDVRFGYDTVSHAANISAYATYTAWVLDTYTTGQLPYANITSLTSNTTYYFNVIVANDVGTSNGTELSFTTEAVLDPPANLVLRPDGSSIHLEWHKGAGAEKTLVMGKLNSYPTATNDGTQIYFDSLGSATHSGLTSGDTWYYMLWSYATGLGYTSDNITGMMTVHATADEGDSLPDPTEPTGWFQSPDYTNMSHFPLYDIVNSLADSWQMPRGNFWLLGAILIAVLFGLVAFAMSNSMLWSALATTLGIIIGWSQLLIPLWFMLIYLVFILAIIVVRERA